MVVTKGTFLGQYEMSVDIDQQGIVPLKQHVLRKYILIISLRKKIPLNKDECTLVEPNPECIFG